MKHGIKPIVFFLLVSTAISGSASSLIYKPDNPSFGGASGNGSYLLSNAKAQNQFEDPASKKKNLTPLEEFNQRLQRSLLSRMTSVISRSVIGSNGAVHPGTFETTDFIINISDLGGGKMNITTTDKVTGDETSVVIETGL